MKLAPKPIIRMTGTGESLSARASGSATGAIIRIVTTLSTNIEMTPARNVKMITRKPGRPPESFSAGLENMAFWRPSSWALRCTNSASTIPCLEPKW